MNRPCGDIAIIGMACIFPGAPDLKSYWQNIVSKVDSVSEPPEGSGYEECYDPDSKDIDRIYCKRGGYLGNLAKFDPLEFGILPASIEGGESDHFLALRVAHEAISDAMYLERPMDRKRVEVIIGKGTLVNRGFANMFQHVIVIDQTLLEEIKRTLKASLPPLGADNLPSLIPNLLSSRVANRLDFMGPNYILDAACASSLIAIDHGVQDLLVGKCDLAIVGGVNASQSPPVLMAFCAIDALSRKGEICPFDKDADGTLLGEGVGLIILKRREDAERDDDRIYALIKGVGTASDGRAMGLLTPRVEGEELAMRRAYDMAGISPDTVELIEAHGTGTLVGDAVEIQAMSRVFGPRKGIPTIAVGSVKSMISHVIPAAGVAGLIKTALALHYKIIPPTLHFKEPNPDFEIEKTPFYISTETRPWIHGGNERRRAGVSAFGFGGINAHVVLEEYTGDNVHDRSD
jgi:acyl transferase domain-containing protein